MIRFHLTLCVMLDIKHMLNTSIKLQYYSLWYRTGVFKYRYVGGYIDTPQTNIIMVTVKVTSCHSQYYHRNIPKIADLQHGKCNS